MSKEQDIDYFRNKVILHFSDELKEYASDNDLPYILFGSFALFMSELIKKKQESELLKKASLLIEEMAESENSNVRDLLMVGFLEVFADEDKSVEYSRMYFSKLVNDALDIVLDYWRCKK